nr:lipopolysaccharide biosynthesis protein [Halomonas sp. UBA3074]
MLSPKDKFFSADHLKAGLKERAVKSAGITLVAQAIKLILQVGSIVILARLLEPTDFGLIAMVTVFTGLALQFMEGGLSMATIQRDQITHGQVSNLFWINAGLGAGMCVLGILAAPLVANLYDEPRLTLIMATMSLTFLIGGLSVQHDAILRRQMRFRAISVIDITSMALGIIAGIIAAFGELGYWALVISTVITFLTKTIFRWISTAWFPSLIRRGTGVRPMLNFGVNLLGANFVGYFANNITPFAVAYIGGAQSMGLYNRANTITSIPSKQLLPPLMNVMQPTLARVAQNPERLRTTIISLMGKIVLCTMFLTITMATLADWIVELFLGAGWSGVVPIFRMLAIFSFVEPIAGLLAVSLIAVGNAKALLHWKVITLGILILSIAIGAFWGAFGVVAAYALSGVFIRLPLFLYYASRFLPVSFADFTKALFPAIFCAAGTVLVLYVFRQFYTFENPIIGLLYTLPIAVVSYIALGLSLKATRAEILGTIKILKLLKIKPRGRK